MGMDRSFAAHPPRRLAPGQARGWLERARALGGVAGAVRARVAPARRGRAWRLTLLALAIALPVLGGGWLWFRHSSFVSVERVRISGVRGADAAAVEAALTQAARGMSTLDVSTGALSAAVAPLHVVSQIRAIPSFPHGLRIEVTEQLPVASLDVAGVRTALAADGTVLGPELLSSTLPSVTGTVAPAPGQHVHGAGLLEALTVLGAAPQAIARHVERVFMGAHGLTVAMRNGLLVYFGNDTLPHAKWLSLVRVLADSGSAGASYVDVRVPARPAAGFPAGVTPPDATATTGTSTSEQSSSTESTIDSLAAALAVGTSDTSSTGTESSSSTAGSTATESSQAPAPAGEATSSTGTGETSGTSESESAATGTATPAPQY